MTTILNPAPGLADCDPALVAAADFLVPNESEAEFLTGIAVRDAGAAEAAAADLRRKVQVPSFALCSS